MHSLRYNTPFPSTNSSSVISSLREEDIFYFPTICEGLQQVSDKCYAVKLQECYDDHDVEYHMAYLLEDLKTNGVMRTNVPPVLPCCEAGSRSAGRVIQEGR